MGIPGAGWIKCLLLSGLLVLAPGVRAEAWTVHASLLGEYMTRVSPTLDQSSGLMLELLSGAMKQAGISSMMAPEAAWETSQIQAMDEPGAILPLLGKTPAREAHWRWLAVMYVDHIYAYTLVGKPVYTSLDELAEHQPRIGVRMGVAPESLLKSRGVMVESVAQTEQNLMKLLSNRLDVVVANSMEISPAIEGLKQQPVWRGQLASLHRTDLGELPLWVVTSRTTPAAQARHLQEALEHFRQTTEYKAIVRRYEEKVRIEQ